MLISLGYEVDVFCILKSKNASLLKEEGILIKYIENKKVPSYIERFFKPVILKKYLKKKDYDVIIDGRTRPVFLKEFILQKIVYNKLKKVFIIHSTKTEDYLFIKGILSDFLYSECHLVTVSNDIKESIKTDYGFSKVIHIPNALPSSKEMFCDSKEVLNENYILFFGRLVDTIKDISFLIKSFQQSNIYKKGYKFIVLGSGVDEEKLKQLTVELNIESKVVFIPFVADPSKYIKQAKLSVMASFYEGMPMSIIESLSLGCPVVTTDFRSGPSEIIYTGENGILVKEKTIQNFSEALIKMCNDEIFYQKCVEGTKNSVEKFSFTNVSKQWDKFLKEI